MEGNKSSGAADTQSGEEEEEDKMQQKFIKELKETIEELQTDIIVANSSKTANNNNTGSSCSQHNLFQTFKVTFRMFSLTVLHHDPPEDPGEENSATKRLLVDRMKSLSDNYFDWVSTIDASNLTSVNSTSIDKNTFMKYHQALAFNDHFLILMKPINLSLNQKINQRHLSGNRRQSQLIKYSLNEVNASIGYIQLNEYLVSVNSPGSKSKESFTSLNANRRLKTSQIIEASKAATITELVSFTDNSPVNSGQLQVEQPCLKVQFVIYEPIELINQLSRSAKPAFHKAGGSIQSQLLSRHFENISIHLNQSLECELDISIIDRLYYLINDISKYSGTKNQSPKKKYSHFNEPGGLKKFQNFEIKCSQQIKLALRFPIADLRRAAASQPTPPKSSNNASSLNASTTTGSAASNTKNVKFLAQPVTMCAFRQLREQVLTFHIFEFNFQTLLNQKLSQKVLAANSSSSDQLSLAISCSQINAYYQYSRKERPIHFGLIQQRVGEPRSLIVSIKLASVDSQADTEPDELQSLHDYYFPTGSSSSRRGNVGHTELDSLKINYNINVGKANRFTSQTIREENETSKEESSGQEESSDEASSPTIEHTDAKKKQRGGKHDADEEDDEEEDEDSCGPFSRIHSLISSEKNRRIVNAGNKQEMQSFMQQSKQNSHTVIRLSLPVLKFLIADQKFLNDIYNCFLNDLIMWMPSPVPPIESALNLFFDTNGMNYLIDYNFDTEFIATRMNLAAGGLAGGSEEEPFEGDDKQFHMCRSAILKPAENENSEAEGCESDDDTCKRKHRRRRSQGERRKQKLGDHGSKGDKKQFKNTLSIILNVEQAHLKAFVLNNSSAAPTTAGNNPTGEIINFF